MQNQSLVLRPFPLSETGFISSQYFAHSL